MTLAQTTQAATGGWSPGEVSTLIGSIVVGVIAIIGAMKAYKNEGRIGSIERTQTTDKQASVTSESRLQSDMNRIALAITPQSATPPTSVVQPTDKPKG